MVSIETANLKICCSIVEKQTQVATLTSQIWSTTSLAQLTIQVIVLCCLIVCKLFLATQTKIELLKYNLTDYANLDLVQHILSTLFIFGDWTYPQVHHLWYFCRFIYGTSQIVFIVLIIIHVTVYFCSRIDSGIKTWGCGCGCWNIRTLFRVDGCKISLLLASTELKTLNNMYILGQQYHFTWYIHFVVRIMTGQLLNIFAFVVPVG